MYTSHGSLPNVGFVVPYDGRPERSKASSKMLNMGGSSSMFQRRSSQRGRNATPQETRSECRERVPCAMFCKKRGLFYVLQKKGFDAKPWILTRTVNTHTEIQLPTS